MNVVEAESEKEAHAATNAELDLPAGNSNCVYLFRDIAQIGQSFVKYVRPKPSTDARSLSDMGLSEFCRQMEYKTKRYGTHLVFADRWFPSSKLMSCYGHKLDRLALGERRVVCPACGISHDRNYNVAINLERLATETALPVASDSAMNRTARGMSPIAGGKVTPVKAEVGQQGASGREGSGAHICARFS
uniref:zinc ribbon domain-containing protein n=1 Tax=Cupriavidus yeoncheonensis TaxID=1462994 RepID=UPI003F490F10